MDQKTPDPRQRFPGGIPSNMMDNLLARYGEPVVRKFREICPGGLNWNDLERIEKEIARREREGSFEEQQVIRTIKDVIARIKSGDF
jgi:hypothetical protein